MQPSEPWYAPRYRNRGNIVEFLGDTQASFWEAWAVRLTHRLNGHESLDWTYERPIVSAVREVGPGLRIGNFLTAFYIVILATAYLDTPLLGQFDLYRSGRDSRMSNRTVTMAILFWTVSHALLCIAYTLIRWGNRSTSIADDFCTPFFRLPVKELVEQRVNRPVTCSGQISRLLMALFYGFYFFLAGIATYTTLAHLHSNKNPWFGGLLILQAVCAAISSLDDITQIGGPFGIQEASKAASIILAVRGLVLVPNVMLWSVAAVYASFPPYECIEC